MYIVENFFVIGDTLELCLETACKNVKSRLQALGDVKLIPNTFSYPHGTTYEMDYSDLKILVHHYNDGAAEQYQISIAYE